MMKMYLIATPIGNLGDFSFRAVQTIQTLDYLLCEDTRRTKILLDHYNLALPLKSFHVHNEKTKQRLVIEDIKKGKLIGLVSDAGTPGISDPGSRLVESCRQNDIEVIVIPGACAAIVALTASGLDTTRFQFVGFLPKKKGKASTLLKEILDFPGTTICYESPYRIISSLKALQTLDSTRKCVVCRELTKKFEEYITGTPGDLIDHFTQFPPKGEFVLIIA